MHNRSSTPQPQQQALLLPLLGRLLCTAAMATSMLPFDAIVGLALLTTTPSLPAWSTAASIHQAKYLPHWVPISKVMHLLSMPISIVWVAVALYGGWTLPALVVLLLVRGTM